MDTAWRKSGLMAKKEEKTNAMRMLDRSKMNYLIHRYDCDEFLSGTEVAQMLNEPCEKVFKTIVVQGISKTYYVFCLPVHKELDLKKCAKTAGEKSVDMVYKLDLEKLTGYIAGGCSPIGMKKQFKTWIDESCLQFDSIYFSGGKRGIQIEMNPKDLISFVSAKTASLTK